MHTQALTVVPLPSSLEGFVPDKVGVPGEPTLLTRSADRALSLLLRPGVRTVLMEVPGLPKTR